MGYRTILVELNSDDAVEARLRAARSLAARFGAAALVGMHVTPPALDSAVWAGLDGAYVPPELVEAQRKALEEARRGARAAFDAAAGGDGPPVAWREAAGDPGPLLAEAARAADLVVAGKGPTATVGVREVVEELVVAAGVPVLALPPDGGGAPGGPGRTVLVGWNGRREAARAAHGALPFLRAAERVVLCAVGARAGAGLDDAAAMLGRHDVPVRPGRVAGSDADAGEILLDQAAAHGADLLVMGAYGHSRLREAVLGGTTRQMLRQMTVPVLFSR